MSKLPKEFIEQLHKVAAERTPDFDAAIDLGRLAAEKARDSIKVVAMTMDHPAEIAVVMMIAALELYHASKTNIRKMPDDAVPRVIFEAMDQIFDAPDEEGMIAAKEAGLAVFAAAARRRKNG